MDQRTYRGDIDPGGLADALVLQFNTRDLKAQKVGQREHLLVQIATRDWGWGGPQSALTVGIARVEGGVQVSLGQERWLGAVADLAQTGLQALVNPLSLIGRLDDVARSVSGLTLPQQVWDAVEHYCDSVGASLGMSVEETIVTCPYCGVGNPIGAPKCSACGAPLGDAQPVACARCGLLNNPESNFCVRCGAQLVADADLPARSYSRSGFQRSTRRSDADVEDLPESLKGLFRRRERK
ncbi:MAG: zinc ribbon domain-containing protein [Anaerolineae bacterium]|nr:zinc ribbon domain-containing protein [Anaerolineae bacterium]